jgi:hypothetical protein
MDVVVRDKITCKTVGVSDTEADWPIKLMKQLGEAIADARRTRELSAVKVSELTEALGVPIHRVAISRIEKGEQAVTVPELVALATALQTDWSGWILDATKGLNIEHERDARVDLRAALSSLDQQLESLSSVAALDEQSLILRIPASLEDSRAARLERMRELIASTQKQREGIALLLARGNPSDG